MSLDCYRDCSELSIFLFFQILETGNLNLLLKNEQGEALKKHGEPSEEQNEEPEYSDEIRELWTDIYNEYCKLSEDNKSLMYFAVCSELLYLEARFEMATILLDQLEKRREHPAIAEWYIEELSKWKYVIDQNKPLDKELERMARKLKASTNKIRLKKDELKGFQSDDDEEAMTLTEQIVRMELILNKNEINPKKTSVEKFVVMMKEIERKNKAQEKLRK